MLMAPGGSCLFIGGGRLHAHSFDLVAGDFAAEPWVQIRHVESISSLGVSWRTVELPQALGDVGVSTHKVGMGGQVMELVVGVEDDDPGQLRLWEAAKSLESYAFRFTFPATTGEPAQRLWVALVTEFSEVIEGSEVIRLRATLVFNSNTIKVQAA